MGEMNIEIAMPHQRMYYDALDEAPPQIDVAKSEYLVITITASISFLNAGSCHRPQKKGGISSNLQ